LGVSLAVATLVILRAFVWVFWEQSHFDSDQAVIGLMAKHIAEARAFPLMFYGQQYMLAVEAWLAAPLFVMFGASVATLKLPLVAINVVCALLLWYILVRDVGLSSLNALVASLFFILPPPVAASRLVEAQGANVEPFLYTLLLWLTRAHPVTFGLIAGVGCMHREFTAYAVVAIVLLEARNRTWATPANLRAKTIVAGEILAVALLVRLLMGHADLFGPGTAGTLPPEALNSQVRHWLSRLCFHPAAIAPNLQWLFQHNLGTLFGWRVEPLSGYVRSGITAGHLWALAALIVIVADAAVSNVFGRSSHLEAPVGHQQGGVPGPSFPAYLVIVGGISLGVYTLLSCEVRDAMLVRYILLALFIPAGVTATLLRSSRPGVTKRIAIAAVLAWAAASWLDNVRVLTEYIRHAPRNEYRQLADLLEQEGIRYGRAPYWTAYHVDFLTGERVVLGSYDRVRITAYEEIVRRHLDESAEVSDGACQPTEDGISFRRWCVRNFSRARHPVAGR
jgi:hypothetical protein